MESSQLLPASVWVGKPATQLLAVCVYSVTHFATFLCVPGSGYHLMKFRVFAGV